MTKLIKIPDLLPLFYLILFAVSLQVGFHSHRIKCCQTLTADHLQLPSHFGDTFQYCSVQCFFVSGVAFLKHLRSYICTLGASSETAIVIFRKELSYLMLMLGPECSFRVCFTPQEKSFRLCFTPEEKELWGLGE